MKKNIKRLIISLVIIITAIALLLLFYHPRYGFKLYSINKPDTCVLCGGKVATIIYGYIYYYDKESSLYKRIQNKEVVLGGCIIYADGPDYKCTKCGQYYWQLRQIKTSKKTLLRR